MASIIDRITYVVRILVVWLLTSSNYRWVRSVLIRRSRERRVPKMIRFANGDTVLRNPSVQYASFSLGQKSRPYTYVLIYLAHYVLRVLWTFDAGYYTYPRRIPITALHASILEARSRHRYIYVFFLSSFSFLLPILPQTKLSFFSFIERACRAYYPEQRIEWDRKNQEWKNRGVFRKNKKRDAWSTRCNIGYLIEILRYNYRCVVEKKKIITSIRITFDTFKIILL